MNNRNNSAVETVTNNHRAPVEIAERHQGERTVGFFVGLHRLSRAGEAGKRRWWLLAASGMFTLVSGGVFWFWQERFFLPVLLALTVAAYISINWEKANRECENGECSRFYAVTVAGRIVNVLGTALAMKGRTESFGRWKDTH